MYSGDKLLSDCCREQCKGQRWEVTGAGLKPGCWVVQQDREGNNCSQEMQRAEAKDIPWYLGFVLCPVRMITFNPIERCQYTSWHLSDSSFSLIPAPWKQSILIKASCFTICPASFFILCYSLTKVLTAFHRNIFSENTSLTRVEERREFEFVPEMRVLSFLA